MEKEFERLITGYLETQIGISDNFLSRKLTQHLKINLLALNAQKLLVDAGTGHAKKLHYNNQIRSDSIYWLDRKHKNQYENTFLDIIEGFIIYLNKTCYAGIKEYEFHYSLYEPGSFYTLHRDQFNDNNTRKYSMIFYLNTNWRECDGGHLLVEQTAGSQKIAPTSGKTVFFKSDEMLHEVQITHARRLSVAGWLKTE